MGKLSVHIQTTVPDRLEKLTEDPQPAVCGRVEELSRFVLFHLTVGKDRPIPCQVKNEIA